MTFIFGRRRLVVSLISELPETVEDLFPVAYVASDKELMRLNKLASTAAERVSRDVNVVMYGAGWFR